MDDTGAEAPEVGAVLAANQAFYDAHEARDFDAMMALWETNDRVTCTHPGWPMLRGHQAVAESWRSILGGPGRNQFILTDVAVEVEGDLAWVTCDENLLGAGSTSAVAAINLFVRGSSGWLMVGHHGSPVMT